MSFLQTVGRSLVGVLWALATVAPLGAELATVALRQGGAVRGELLADRPDRVVIDLGFTVLAIPREAVTRVTVEVAETELEDAANTAGDDNLYRLGNGQPAQTVREQVEQIGGAVVLVRTPSGLGSGFIIHPEGYIITNDHVIAGETEVTVTVWDRTATDYNRTNYSVVRIVATSPDMDLALLKIEDGAGRAFPIVALGRSAELRQGQQVFAIGNPLGLERSVSTGIVSQRNRPVDGRLLIQTTTQINPGNSGGPLFNLEGEVVGVNNLKVVAFGAEGLGFAIPSATVIEFLENRDAFAFDPLNPNAGVRYNTPPRPTPAATP